jgi:NAD(P)-dependent dehydrogenase (short-subunit alcohol dehydrogenase family)
MSERPLSGQVALVAGATRGAGRAIAVELARAGDAERWKGSIVSARQLADAYGVMDTDGSRPDCWGYIAAYGWEQEEGRGIEEFR